MKNWRESEIYKRMNSYTACSIAEGFADDEISEEEYYTAWQWLVDRGICWKLQGFYGRTAVALMEDGLIDKPTPGTLEDFIENGPLPEGGEL